MKLDLSKVDRIVTDVKFLHDLIEWANAFYESHPQASINLYEIAVFNEIVWDIAGTLVYFHRDQGEARFAIVTPDGKLDAIWRAKYENEAMQIYASKDETMETDLMNSFTSTTIALMHYVREYREEPNAVVEVRERTRKEKKPKKGQKHKRVTYLTRRAIKVTFIEKAAKREWTRRAGSWNVKKHPRTYHRGTEKEFTIWIETHVRGTGEITPKEYRP